MFFNLSSVGIFALFKGILYIRRFKLYVYLMGIQNFSLWYFYPRSVPYVSDMNVILLESDCTQFCTCNVTTICILLFMLKHLSSVNKRKRCLTLMPFTIVISSESRKGCLHRKLLSHHKSYQIILYYIRSWRCLQSQD